jgi:C_GCAxxG_C_C family probable redox protein
MSDANMRMMELALQGFRCSQILMTMALEAQQRSNPDLVRAVCGLQGGMGCGKACGALTGACCVLGLFAGKGTPQENGDERLSVMLASLVEWFEQEHGSRYGGIDCTNILEDDPRNQLTRCPQVVLSTFEKLNEILEANDYRLDQVPGSAD